MHAALCAKSRRCAVLLTGSGFAALAAASAALTVACASALFVRFSSSLCVATSASAIGFKLDALNERHGLPPERLGSFQPPRLAQDLPVGIGTSSLRQAS